MIIHYHCQPYYVILPTQLDLKIDKFPTEGEFGEVDEALFAGVWRHVPERLDGEVALDVGGVKGVLHLLHPLQTDERVEVTVDSHNIRSWEEITVERNKYSSNLKLYF